MLSITTPMSSFRWVSRKTRGVAVRATGQPGDPAPKKSVKELMADMEEMRLSIASKQAGRIIDEVLRWVF
jgi:hypothetical protein